MDPTTSTTVTALNAMIVGDALGRIAAPWQVLVFALMLGSAGWAVRRPAAAATAAFLACAAMWSRANQAFEGPILWTFSVGHGLCAADLWPPLLVGLMAWRSAVRPHHRRRRRSVLRGGPGGCEALALSPGRRTSAAATQSLRR